MIVGFVRPVVGSGFGQFDMGAGTSANIFHPRDLAFDKTTGDLFVTAESNTLWKISGTTGELVPYLGAIAAGYVDGVAAVARFSSLMSVDVNSEGNIFVYDANNYRIRKITLKGTRREFFPSIHL